MHKGHLPKLCYQFEGSTPSKEFLISETNRLMTRILSNLNLNCHLPIAIRHAPINRMGFNYPHLYCEAGLISIRQWLKHHRRKSSTAQHFSINSKWLQLIAGMSSHILTDTSTPLPHLPQSRITWLRQFINDINGFFITEESFLPKRNCKGEPSIMDIILTKKWTPKEIQQINDVRMYLQFFWITDITDTQSLTIHPYIKFKSKIAPSHSTMTWPNTSKPPSKSISTWRKAILMVEHHIKHNFSTDKFPWHPIETLQRKWHTNIGTTDQKLFILRDSKTFTTTNQRRTTITEGV